MTRGRRSKTLVLDRAVARWDARAYDGKLDALLDLSGNGLHARLGSAVGADSNDPLRLQYRGQKALHMPGAAANYLSTPDKAGIRITTKLSGWGFIAPNDWTPASAVAVLSKYNTAGQRSFIFDVETTAGKLRFRASTDGTTLGITATSTASPTISDGALLAVAFEYDPATGNVTFYTSSDLVTWTQLGDVVATAGGTIFYGTDALEVGSNSGGSSGFSSAVLYRAKLIDGSLASGVAVADFDASKLTEPYASYTDAQGNVWTLNRSASGRKLAVIDRDLLLFGTDDYLEIADSPLLNFGAGQAATVVALCRTYGTQNDLVFIAKRAGLAASNAGYSITRGTSSAAAGEVANGTSEVTATASAYSAGVATLHAVVRSGTMLRQFLDGTGGTAQAETLGALSNTEVLRFGRLSGAGTSYNDMEFIGGAIFREALTADELVRLKGEMLR